MSLMVELPGGGIYGEVPTFLGSNTQITFGAVGLATSANNRVAFCFRAPRAGTLHSFEVRTGTIFNNPANGLRFSFQDGATNLNNPDGVEDQYRVIPSPLGTNVWLAPPGPITHDGTDTGNKRVVVAKERVFCVIRFENFLAGNDIEFKTINIETGRNAAIGKGPAFCTRFAGGVWTNQNVGLIIAIRYDDGYEWVSPLYYPILTLGNTFFLSTSSPDEIGLRFQNPFNCKLEGVLIRLAAAGTAARANINLYDSASNILETFAFNPTEIDVPTGTLTWMYIPFAQTPELFANATYRIGIQPQNASANMQIEWFDSPSNDYFDCFSGGKEWYYTSRTDSGAWTDNTSRRPWMAIHVAAVPPVAGGGETSHLSIG